MSRDKSAPSRPAQWTTAWPFFLGAIGILCLAGCWPLPFDKKQWDIAPKTWSDTTRHRMADGFLRSGKLIGLSEAEVIAMLGEPSQSGYFAEYDLVYELGAERGLFRIDSEWLVMRLESGMIVEARLVED